MIRIENISKRFGSQVVLDNISLSIQDGQTTAIVGPSGVGKSVLLKLIMGILQPDPGSGAIWIGKNNMLDAHTETEKNVIRKELGVLFQAAALFDSLTVYDNIAFPLVERSQLSRTQIHEKVVNMIEALSLEDYAFNYTEEISIGIRKRVGMARALITEPKVLLFDEPNTGLDPLVGQEVYELIKLCRKHWGFTGVVISHELPEVFQVSDHVVMLLGGKIIAQGTPAELIQSENPAVQQFLKGSTHGPIRIQ